jgi:hypothetical protein
MDEQIVPSKSYGELVNNPYISEYIELAFQAVPLVRRALELPHQLSQEKTIRLEIQKEAEKQRLIIERRMDQLDAELEADFESSKHFVIVTMRVFEKLIEDGRIEEAMILHERVINKLSGRVSIAADKFNQNSPDGQVRFYTT